jgi:DNA-binding LacI/PurR family transcriptional regulator
VAVNRAYRVFLGHVHRQIDIAVDYGSMFEQYHADGILIVGELAGDEEALEILLRQHRYVVGVSDRTHRRTFPGVYADSVLGTRLALDHLWNLGHRNILYVTDPTLQDALPRAEVYAEYMREHSVGEDARIIHTSRSFQSSYETGMEIFASLDSLNCPTAITAATDAIAIGLLKAAYQSRIAVPDHISIVGFDDINIAAFTTPALTTIRQSGFEMGQTAAGLLLDMIEQELDRTAIEDIILTPSLVVRESSAAPASI